MSLLSLRKGPQHSSKFAETPEKSSSGLDGTHISKSKAGKSMRHKSLRIGKWIFAFYAYKMPESKNEHFVKQERKEQETR